MVHPPTNITTEGAPGITHLNSAQHPRIPQPGPTKFGHGDYTRFMARSTTLRKSSGIRGLLHLELQPGVISLLTGKPNPKTFPIEQLSITLRSPAAPQPYQLNVQPSSIVHEKLTLEDDEIPTALQYSFTDGIPELRQILVEFQRKEHGVDIDNVKLQLAVGGGSQDLLYKALSSVLDPGDSVLVEAPVCAGVLPILQTLEADIVGKSKVEADLSGFSIDHLRFTLESWPVGKRLPKVLYTVPFGCNLTGATTILERRKALLELAEEYDFLILEDDPYFFLYFGSDERPPSYLSLENIRLQSTRRQRRVLRFDSFSKVISGGLRVGFVTGPPELVKVMNSHTSAAYSPSTTQSVILAIFKHWGHAGFRAHVTNIADFYRTKRDIFDKAMVKHFRPQGGRALAEWTKPEAGLFFWLKINLPPSRDDLSQLIQMQALAKGVLAVPGTTFYPNGRQSAYVRAAFSMLEKEDVDEALMRLAEVVKEAME